MEKLSMESVDITKENIEKIKELFPQVVTEGKIDFDVLKEILGEQIESRNERYQFTWSGKSDSIRFAQRPSTGTLLPDKELSKNWDSTENLYIEGDNLEVLKLLQKSYHNKIKMIYIDPPYNTGGDFVYKDDFKDSIKNYKEQTNQTLRANPETSGRYHTDWLNMMYPRLMLAKNLLSDDGVIFISIDDNEIDNLYKMCSEIFGEDNLIAKFVWNCSTGGGIRPKFVSKTHEYVLSFAKDKNKLPMLFAPLSRDAVEMYTKNDEYGVYREKDFVFKNKSTNINQKYLITCPDGSKVKPKVGYIYRFIEETFFEALNNNLVVFKKTKTGPLVNENGNQADWNIYIKKYLGDGSGCPTSILPKDLISIYNVGTKFVQDLFSGKRVFENVKPVDLVNYLINIAPGSDLVLDFFSGSATTANAVMQLNSEDGGNRKFIMVQLPEKTDEKSEAFKAGFENICEIGKERIRRAGDKIKNELIEKRNKQGMIEDTIDPEQLDIGFKVFKLDTSNLKTFDSTSKNLENIFSEDVFLPERSSLDILYEILLKYGVFDKPVDVIQINGKEAFSIAMNQTIVYINQTITESDVLAIAKLAPREVIFDERGFVNDNDKINALKRLETAGVEKVATI